MKLVEVAAPLGFPQWHCGVKFDNFVTKGKEFRTVNGKPMIVLDMPEGAFEMFESDAVYKGWLVLLEPKPAPEIPKPSKKQ